MKLVLIITITLSIFSTIPSYGQEKSKEDSNTKEESWYSRFTRRKIEESTLFKLGFKGLGAGHNLGHNAYSVTIETSIEHKFTQFVSFNLKVKNTFGKRIKLELDKIVYSIEEDVKPFYNIDVSPEIRFYLGINKGIKKRKRANNFTGRFIALQFDEILNIGKTNYEHQKINLLFGIQQRLWKFGYIDLMLGRSYWIQEKKYYLFSEFAIGFAF